MVVKVTLKKPAPKKPAPKKPALAVAPAIVKSDEQRWQAEDDLRTMQRMADLKSDPQRLKRVEALIKQQLAALNKVKGKA